MHSMNSEPAIWRTCTLVTVKGIVDPLQMRLPVQRPSKRFALAFGVTAFPQQVHLLLPEAASALVKQQAHRTGP